MLHEFKPQGFHFTQTVKSQIQREIYSVHSLLERYNDIHGREMKTKKGEKKGEGERDSDGQVQFAQNRQKKCQKVPVGRR